MNRCSCRGGEVRKGALDEIIPCISLKQKADPSINLKFSALNYLLYMNSIQSMFFLIEYFGSCELYFI